MGLQQLSNSSPSKTVSWQPCYVQLLSQLQRSNQSLPNKEQAQFLALVASGRACLFRVSVSPQAGTVVICFIY